VCIHEQDEGIGWKHTNFRTGNPSVTRSRVLVVQSMITVYVDVDDSKLYSAKPLSSPLRYTSWISHTSIVPTTNVSVVFPHIEAKIFTDQSSRSKRRYLCLAVSDLQAGWRDQSVITGCDSTGSINLPI
jgi:hypothetical protein